MRTQIFSGNHFFSLKIHINLFQKIECVAGIISKLLKTSNSGKNGTKGAFNDKISGNTQRQIDNIAHKVTTKESCPLIFKQITSQIPFGISFVHISTNRDSNKSTYQ
ncbi:hypothetical protein [Labilibaculum sp.]|uniref:hypothetical protein n=1 Tax=Labilibaculum sp. TaxID=2060723 RepID=UPI0035626950